LASSTAAKVLQELPGEVVLDYGSTSLTVEAKV